MRLRAPLIASWLAVVSLAFSPRLQAQEPTPEKAPESTPAQDDKQRASERFRSGVALFQEGAFRAALVEFERAYQIAPDFRLLYNIGQVQFQLGDYLGATHSYERYLTEGGSQVTKARRDDVEAALKVLNQRVGRVSIKCNVDGAEIFVDDQAAGVTPLPSTVVVNVGRHRVFARSADGATSTEMIDVAGGDLRELNLTLKAPNLKIVTPLVADSPPMTPRKKLAIGAWAAAGALAIGATIAGFSAQDKVDDRKAELKNEPADEKKLNNLEDSARSRALMTDVLGGLALSALTAGVVIWVLDAQAAESPDEQGPSVSFGVGPSSVSATGSF